MLPINIALTEFTVIQETPSSLFDYFNSPSIYRNVGFKYIHHLSFVCLRLDSFIKSFRRDVNASEWQKEKSVQFSGPCELFETVSES